VTDSADGLEHLAPYHERLGTYPAYETLNLSPGGMSRLPIDFRPWWNTHIGRATRQAASLDVTLDGLTLGALNYSPQVLAVAVEAEARQTYVAEEQGEFDWRGFLEMTYDDRSDPVGNALTVGDPDITRFRDNQWVGDYGFRRKMYRGGELEINQRLGFQDTNSEFFLPPRQGTARLEINYTQPLLNGAGMAYNHSRIVVAQIDGNVARDEFHIQVQDHLLEVTQAYWELYRARALYLQKQRLLQRATNILETLKAREAVDAVRRQVLRARSAVTSRHSEIARAYMSIRNSESKLRLLVNDPGLLESTQLELVPRDLPRPDYIPVSVRGSLQTALCNRPDVAVALRDIRAAGVRLGVAENELLPKLDLVLGVYSAGLEGYQKIYQAYANQFSVLEPGYSIGLLLEVPLGNQTARARHQRRELEFRRALLEFRATVETGLTEVELAAREVETTYQELLSKHQAMLAAEEEAEYLDRRWRLLPQEEGSTAQLLEDLLDAQERLAQQEADFASAEVAYALALARLKRSMGTLLRVNSVELPCAPSQELPQIVPEEVPPEDVPAATAVRRLPRIGHKRF
jgi:outer membrane protein TolC